MKLSNNTLAILNNFSKINDNIYIRTGNVIRTVSIAEDISAYATVEETFETEFAIYELTKFLRGLRLYENPELEFFEDDGYLLIKQGTHTIKYFLTEPDLVKAPENRNMRLPSEDVCFQMKAEQFDKLMKASNVFGLQDFTVLGKKGEITLQVRNKSNPTSNQASIVVGKTDEEFELNFDKNNLLMIEGSYDVVISKQMAAKFTNQDFDLTYFVGLSSDSSFNS
jgi:hypothetical protein